MMIQKLEGEVDEWEKKYESALKDICRLETKVHSHQLDYKSESEILRVEVKKRDERLYELSMEVEKLREQLCVADERISEYIRVCGNGEQQLRDVQSAQKMKDETLVYLETHLDESQQKVKELSAKVARLDEQHRITLGEAAALKKANDELQHRVRLLLLTFLLIKSSFLFQVIRQSESD